jgi:hypothetical protein
MPALPPVSLALSKGLQEPQQQMRPCLELMYLQRPRQLQQKQGHALQQSARQLQWQREPRPCRHLLSLQQQQVYQGLGLLRCQSSCSCR